MKFVKCVIIRQRHFDEFIPNVFQGFLLIRHFVTENKHTPCFSWRTPPAPAP